MGDPQLIRWATLAGVVVVVVVATRFFIRRAMTADDREAYKRLRKALDSGDLRRAGDVQLSRGLYVEAARIYERAGDHARAARAWLKHGDHKAAALQYEKAQDFTAAAPLFRKIGDPMRAAACYERVAGESEQLAAADCFAAAKEHLRAGRLYEKLGQLERAVDELALLERLDPPDLVVVMLENAAVLATDAARKRALWERAGAEALRLGMHERAAKSFDRAGALPRAALLYEEALRRPATAAAIYEELGDREAVARLSKIVPGEAIARERAARAQARGDTPLAQLAPSSPPPGAAPATAVAGKARAVAGVMSTPSAGEAGRFELMGELGRGGMGIVYRARDKRLDRLVALKFLPEDMEADPTLVKVFRREARAAAALTHAGIVTVYDVGTLDGREFIAMELVEGTTLDRVLAEKGPLPVRQAVEIFDKVLDAVGAAHERGVIHRDLKPGNIMRTKSGIKVMDFGLAKLVSGPRTSKQNTIIGGTPGYTPPEQMLGEADHRADIFAAGATFYELLTGKLPAKDGAPASMATGYPTPHELVPAVPERLSALIMRCLEHDVGKRVQDVPSLQRELRLVRSALDDIERELQAFLSESMR